MKTWFTSDTHFGSERTLKLSKRPFKSVEEMDETIIGNWNEIVSKEDVVYHLGDFGDYKNVKRLNGDIVLIFGNYERCDDVSIEELLDLGFDDVITEDRETCWFYDIKNDVYKEENLCLNMAHKPNSVAKPYAKNEFNIFGHIHKLQMVKRFGLNVGIDCHDFKAVDLDTILFYRNAISNFYDEEVFNQDILI